MKGAGLLPIIAAVFASGAIAAPSPIVPTALFARGPAYSLVRLSPDGRHLAVRRNADRGDLLTFVDLATRREVSVDPGTVNVIQPTYSGGPRRHIASLQWISDQRVVVATSFWGRYLSGVSAVNCDATDWRSVSGLDEERSGGQRAPFGYWGATFFGLQTIYHFDDPEQSILMLDRVWPLSDAPLYPNVVRVSTLSDSRSLVVKNPGNVVSWTVDFDGVVRAGLTRDGPRIGMIYRDRDGASWQPQTLRGPHGGEIRPLGFDRSGRKMYVAAVSPRRRWSIYLLDPASGVFSGPILADPNYDLVPEPSMEIAGRRERWGPLFSRQLREMVGAIYCTEGPRMVWLDPKFIEYQNRIDDALPRTDNLVVDVSAGGKLLLVDAFSDVDPGTYYLYDTAHNHLTTLLALRPWIDPAKLARQNLIQFAARDGQVIHGYLTLPAGGLRRGLPTVVLPHDGPWDRDMWGFDPFVQFLANRGYAVLQINFRGSSGYGTEFHQLGRRQYGGRVQDDIEDATRWAVAHGIADRRRVAIIGTGFGGFSALFALGRDPDLYRCGISFNGITDWEELFSERQDPTAKYARIYWARQIGDPENDASYLRSISPVTFAGRITAPVLLIQATDSQSVPPAQAKRMASALEKAGHPAETLYLSGGDLASATDQQRLEAYRRIEAFLGRNLAPHPSELAALDRIR